MGNNAPIEATIDFFFPKAPCHLISLDLEDELMGHAVNIANVKKVRHSQEGVVLSGPYEVLKEADPYAATKKALLDQEGCRVYGQFTLKEVPGNFHVSFHGYLDMVLRLNAEGVLTSPDYSFKVTELYFGSKQELSKMQRLFPEK